MSETTRNKIRCLLQKDDIDMTFRQIAKEFNFPLSDVYAINSVILNRERLQERIQYEEMKAERLMNQMWESEERRTKKRREKVEQLRIEGFNAVEIAAKLSEPYNYILSDIKMIRKDRRDKEQ